MGIPSQCPECGDITIQVFDVPPEEHDRGDEWMTKAVCEQCDGYEAWF